MWKITLATGVEEQVIPRVRGEYDPKYSPDGTRFAWTSFRHCEGGDIYIADVANPTGSQTRVTPSSGFASGRWSPDGSKLVMVSSLWGGGEGGIWVIDVNGTGQTELIPGAAGVENPGVWWGDVGSAGVTVITHGFRPTGSFPPWVEEMGSAILKRAGKGALWRFDTETDTITDITLANVPADLYNLGGEQVILVDWSSQSNNDTPGFAEGTSHTLYSLLMGGAPCSNCEGGYREGFLGSVDQNGKPQRPFHFIGHSFGTVVNSEAIQRLGALQNPPIQVEQMTMLDPHDWDQAGLPVDEGGASTGC